MGLELVKGGRVEVGQDGLGLRFEVGLGSGFSIRFRFGVRF